MKKHFKACNRFDGHRCMAAVLALGMLVCSCTGCGKGATSAPPELLEPAAINEAYRPVEYGDIGKISVLFGTVVPMDYYAYYKSSVNLASIEVEVGDYVSKGDIIAYADIESAQKQLENQQQAIDSENTTFTINQEIVKLQIAQLQYQKEQLLAQQQEEQQAEDAPDGQEEAPDGQEEEQQEQSLHEEAQQEQQNPIARLDIQIATMQENQRYDTLLHEYRLEKMNAQLANIQQIVSDGILRAGHSGSITYVKNIGVASAAGACEIVAVISDVNDSYIELDDKTVLEYSGYKDYEVKYMMAGNTRYDIEELDYTSDELILCKANNRYPNQRIRCPQGLSVELGDSYPLYYQKQDVRDVLVVGNDSLYEEDGAYFVYVMDENGERKKREITIGAKDDNYTQVVSGLEEKELVYYMSDERMPAEYMEYQVGLSDFEIKNQTMSYELSNATTYLYTSGYEGSMEEVCVKEGQEVAAGDLLYVIRTSSGKAALMQAKSSIEQEALSYADTSKYYSEEIAKLEQQENKNTYDSCELQILKYRSQMADMAHESAQKSLQEAYDSIAQGNDGTGKISVYANESGVIGTVEVYTGEKVEAQDRILTIQTKAKDKLVLQLKKDPNSSLVQYENNVADIGEKVTVSYKDTIYEGTCIGWASGPKATEQNYVCTDEDGAVLLSCGPTGYLQAAFFVEMDDESFYENMPSGKIFSYSYKHMKNVVVIPTNLIHSETKPGNADKKYYFVWRLVDGEMVKQYILIDSENLSTYSQTVVLSGLKPGDVLAADAE